MKRFVLYFSLGVIFLFSGPVAEAEVTRLDPGTQSNYPDVSVLRYDLNLTVDPDRQDFRGSIIYKLEPTKTAPQIIFDSVGIAVTKAEEVTAGGDVLKNLTPQLQVEDETLSIARPFQPSGEIFYVRLEFSHQKGKSKAIHWLSREETRDKKHPAVFTQLESIKARHLFPCQDTSQSSSKFRSTLKVPDALRVFAPGNRTQNKKANGWRTEVYEMPFAMPVYIYAIAAGSFKITTLGRLEVVSEEALHDQAKKVAPRAVGALELFEGEEYLDADYRLNKLRVVFLPPGFFYSGMENMGLVFLNENFAHAANQVTSPGNFLVEHEVAHQWVGNQVSLETWKDLWVNEGLASYLQMQAQKPYWSAADYQMEWQMMRRGSAARKYNQERTRFGSLDIDPGSKDVGEVLQNIGDFYDKGPWIHRELAYQIGEDRVLAFFRHLLSISPGQRVLFSNQSLLQEMKDWVTANPDDRDEEPPRLDHISDLVFERGMPMLEVHCRSGNVVIRQDVRQRYNLGPIRFKTWKQSPTGEYFNQREGTVTLDLREKLARIKKRSDEGFYLDPRGERFIAITHRDCFDSARNLLVDTGDYRILAEFQDNFDFLDLVHAQAERQAEINQIEVDEELATYPTWTLAAMRAKRFLERDRPPLQEMVQERDPLARLVNSDIMLRKAGEYDFFAGYGKIFSEQLKAETGYQHRANLFGLLLGAGIWEDMATPIRRYFERVVAYREWERVYRQIARVHEVKPDIAQRAVDTLLKFGAAEDVPLPAAQVNMKGAFVLIGSDQVFLAMARRAYNKLDAKEKSAYEGTVVVPE